MRVVQQEDLVKEKSKTSFCYKGQPVLSDDLLNSIFLLQRCYRPDSWAFLLVLFSALEK